MLRYVAMKLFMLLYLNFVMGLNVLKIYKLILYFRILVLFLMLVVPSFSSIFFSQSVIIAQHVTSSEGREMRESTHSTHLGLEHVLF